MTQCAETLHTIVAGECFNHAVNPSQTQALSEYFGGNGAKMTRDTVSALYGDVAAFHWQSARDAKAAFFEAVERAKEPTNV